MRKYDDLVKKLREIFQIDRPELDFGVYRILNTRVGEINDYLENRLKAKVQESLSKQAEGDNATKIKELTEKIREEFGKRVFDEKGQLADEQVKESELGQQLLQLQSAAPTAAEHENAVFTHLLTFFSRYYDSGDFISQRRYKGETYAIPYAGEEVMLHWANKDQYYTKSGENFSNYGFKLDDGRTVRFRLVTADTAKDNRKDNDKERRFTLIEKDTIRTQTDDEGEEYEETFQAVTEENGELVLRFEYKVMPKGSKQDALVLEAVKSVLGDENVKARWLDLAKREPTEKNPQRTLLEKCLTSYTTKNTADYFIHKDLGCFLRGELDFYIKNEVMHLDDVQNAEKFADIEKNLRLIQTLRAIALELITFLEQLENFQKKLWLKKKFVVATHYCITLDRVPKSLYPTIAANPLQWEQWEKLGMLEGSKDDLFMQAKAGSVEYLKKHHFLMVDSALFDVEFKYKLLATVDNLDDSLDGLLIHGDNYQALNLLQERYREQVNYVYIDPPYNTSASQIIYKNSYKHSSWLSLISDRVAVGKDLLAHDGNTCVTIDDVEFNELLFLLRIIFGSENFEGIVPIRINPSGRPTERGFALTHEYGIFFGKSEASSISKIPRTEAQLSRFSESDSIGRFEWRNLRREGSNSDRSDGERQYYLIYANLQTGTIRIPNMQWIEDVRSWVVHDSPVNGEVEIYPINSEGVEKNWRWSEESVKNDYSQFLARIPKGGTPQVYYKYRENQLGTTPLTMWTDTKFSATEYGTRVLKDLFGIAPFSYPKSIFAVTECLSVMGMKTSGKGLVLDYFAGSGTTAHSVISLNREGGHNNYILVEQGEYFETVTKPRIQKVVYSADWKDGKATAPQTGISHAFKVIKLESYEDTLNNLQLRRSEEQQSLLDTLPQSANEDYLLRYMLDIESRSSLLSVEQFNKPFDCKLKVAVDSAGAYKERSIDLVETFNYLIGLRVKHIDMQWKKGFVSVTGSLPSGEKTLVLWRDVEQVDYEALNRLCEKLAINPADSEFEIVYINGDHNIPAVFTSTEAEGGITKTLKLRQIEPEFMSRMFAVEDV